MRDIRRFAASAATAARDFAAYFNMTDILALEAIQTFLPAKFGLIAKSREALTTNSDLVAPGAAEAIEQG